MYVCLRNTICSCEYIFVTYVPQKHMYLLASVRAHVCVCVCVCLSIYIHNLPMLRRAQLLSLALAEDLMKTPALPITQSVSQRKLLSACLIFTLSYLLPLF